MVDKPKSDDAKRPTQAPVHDNPQHAGSGRIQGVGAGQPRDAQSPPQHTAHAAAPSTEAAPAPARTPEMSDGDRKRLAELRAKNPAQMPARSPEEEAEFQFLELREQEALWAAQDARVEELQAKKLTPDEERELQDLQMTIDNQRRAQVRRGEPQP